MNLLEKASPKTKKCPHCKGEIREILSYYSPFICSRCGRGWYIDSKGYWHALFCAEIAVYDPKDDELYEMAMLR